MLPVSTRTIASIAISATMLLMVGCTSTTRVTFVGPPGSVLFVDGTPHHLPTTVEFSRPSGSSGSKRHDAGFAFTSRQVGEVHASGYLDALAYTESDIDKLSIPTCYMDEQQLVKIPAGTTVIFRGQSSSHQPVYELTLHAK